MNKELAKVLEWVRELGFNKVQVRSEERTKALNLSLYTDHYEYRITAHPRTKSNSYLGCIVYNRAPLPGERHLRSYDLTDGSIARETWEKIKNDIISTELLPITNLVDQPKYNW
jgi:hypothetical protein